MKKSLMITFLLLCVLCGCAVAEDVGFYLPDDCVMLQCAPSYDSWYTNDPEKLEIMCTLKEYYIAQTKRERYIASGDVILLCNPFIFQIDQTVNEKTVYCVARIDEYGMYQDKALLKHVSLGKSSFSCYRILYDISDDQQTVQSIHQPEKDEEFIPGYGCSTQGNNGITDKMIMIMDDNDYSASTEDFIDIYLRMNKITNCVVHIDM